MLFRSGIPVYPNHQWADATNQGEINNVGRTQSNPSSSSEPAAKGLQASGGNISYSPNTGTVEHLANTGNCNTVYTLSREEEWVLDSGATDHMTHSKTDLINSKQPGKNGIFNANGICYPVSGAGDVILSPTLTLHNTLVVPSLSTKQIGRASCRERVSLIV